MRIPLRPPPPIRPTFDLTVPMDADACLGLLRRGLAGDGSHPHQIRGRHVVLTVPRDLRRFWSPFLHMEVACIEGGASLHGRFSPKPAIWTGFMLSYIGLLTASFFALMLGFSQAWIGESPLGAALSIPFLALALGLYVSSQLGQRMASDQMDELQGLIGGILGLTIAEAAAAGDPPPGARD